MLQCQRIGCNAMFTDDDNPEGSCQFHASPFFHDGMKEWSCCKQRSHDFSLFLEIPGCKKGKHTTEKPVLAKAAPRNPSMAPTSSPDVSAATKDSCARCRQGFFCSDHGSQPKEQIRQQSMETLVQAEEEKIETSAAPIKKVVVIDINKPQVCKNKGCGKTFKERDNHESACSYHPGPAVFHDRLRGWKCCDVHVKEFDEFMEIPPCTKGPAVFHDRLRGVCARFAVIGFSCRLLVVLLLVRTVLSARSDEETRERFYGNVVNSTAPGNGEGSIAKMFDRVLEKEFSENDQPEGSDGASFNSSVADQQAEIETVAKVTHEKGKRNDTQENNGTRPFQFQDVFSLENEDSDDMTLIDKKNNVFVMSNKKSKYPILQVDLRLISDLVVIIVFAAIGGIVFSCLGQPVIVGYLLAGSIIGPGGLKFISEMVQVETVAQFGVVFLLFALGLEFSMTKLKVVGPVAVLGGLLQIVLLMFMCGVTALLCGARLSEGIFVGAFLSMSSTAVVVKFLVERNSTSSLHGQVTIGILIFQDCVVGLLFALLPVLGGNSGLLQGIISMGKLFLILSIYLTVASLLTWSFVPRFLKLMIQLSSQTNELYQLAAVAFCLLSAWCSDKLGLSLELGSFVAGVMLSTTEFAQHTLEQVEPIRNLFAALFLSSIGMLINVHFLWNHVDILLASVILVIVIKTAIAAVVVKAFRYNLRISFHVGVLLAQIGEFAFVLLSRASNLHVIEGKMYLLLLGTTALSLVTTPLLFKLIPSAMNLGVLLRWFPSENTSQNESLQEKASMIEVHNRTK